MTTIQIKYVKNSQMTTPMNDTEILGRIKRIIAHYGESDADFAKRIGVDKSNLSKMLSGQRTIGEGIINKIVLSTDFHKVWIETGEGDMLKSDTNIRYVAPYINEELSGVPYVSASVAATFIENLYSMEYDLETYGVRAEDGEELTNGEYIVFDVIGESMTPTIPGGAKILCRRIKEELWEYANGVAVVIYGKTLTVKRILKNDLYNRNTLTLKADNPIHGEVTVQHSEIRAMWQAIRIISVKIL
jgi:transcriptional regulator with XRE-family HTH domain